MPTCLTSGLHTTITKGLPFSFPFASHLWDVLQVAATKDCMVNGDQLAACWQKHGFLKKAGDYYFSSISGPLWGRMECNVNPSYAHCFLWLPSRPDSHRKLAMTAGEKHRERERWDLSLLFSYHKRGIENWGKVSTKQFLTEQSSLISTAWCFVLQPCQKQAHCIRTKTLC